jgi:hypothetical protein
VSAPQTCGNFPSHLSYFWRSSSSDVKECANLSFASACAIALIFAACPSASALIIFCSASIFATSLFFSACIAATSLSFSACILAVFASIEASSSSCCVVYNGTKFLPNLTYRSEILFL